MRVLARAQSKTTNKKLRISGFELKTVRTIAWYEVEIFGWANGFNFLEFELKGGAKEMAFLEFHTKVRGSTLAALVK